MKKFPAVILFSAALLLSSRAFAMDEVTADPASLNAQPPDKYMVITTLRNNSDKAREVAIRAQLFFFDEVSPNGDKPLAILRKDATIVLKARETRKIRVRLIDEGTVPKERVRLEPEIRLRRQRVWNY